MLDLDTITARAKQAPRQTTDVQVVFDAGLTGDLERLRSERAALEDQIDQIQADLTAQLETLNRDSRAGDSRQDSARAAADDAIEPLTGRLDQVAAELEQTTAQAAEFLVTFRFTALHGFEWADLTARSTPRDGVAEDAGRAYNLDEVTRTAAARSGVRVTDDGSELPVTADQWTAVWETLPAPGLTAIKMSVWYLNEFAWVQARDEAVVAARKASTVPPGPTPPSPSDSGSTPDDSAGGNPSPSPSTRMTKRAA